jgi:hypothetical protein
VARWPREYVPPSPNSLPAPPHVSYTQLLKFIISSIFINSSRPATWFATLMECCFGV